MSQPLQSDLMHDQLERQSLARVAEFLQSHAEDTHRTSRTTTEELLKFKNFDDARLEVMRLEYLVDTDQAEAAHIERLHALQRGQFKQNHPLFYAWYKHAIRTHAWPASGIPVPTVVAYEQLRSDVDDLDVMHNLLAIKANKYFGFEQEVYFQSHRTEWGVTRLSMYAML